jgi:hypothetical protein
VRVEVGAGAPTSLGLAALLDFRLRYFLGDQELSADEWRRLTAAAVGLHRVGDRWVQVDPTAQAQARGSWAEVEAAARSGAVGFADGLRLLAGLPRGWQAATAPVWTVARPGPWLARTLADLQDPRGSAEADPGPALRGTLRPYQRDGVAWLWLLSRLGLGGCLADDMGLGKTIQVVALLLLLRRDGAPGPHLIVLPASLLGNWRAELARFAPDLRVHVAHRSAGDVDAPPPGEVDVVLTTYATLLRQAWLRARPWGLVVLDEAQAIKNAGAKQTRAVKALTARGRLVLTGGRAETISLTSERYRGSKRDAGARGQQGNNRSCRRRRSASTRRGCSRTWTIRRSRWSTRARPRSSRRGTSRGPARSTGRRTALPCAASPQARLRLPAPRCPGLPAASDRRTAKRGARGLRVRVSADRHRPRRIERRHHRRGHEPWHDLGRDLEQHGPAVGLHLRRRRGRPGRRHGPHPHLLARRDRPDRR